MLSALTLKELRESAGLAAVGLAGLVFLVLTSMGGNPLFVLMSSGRPGTIPFIYGDFTWQLAITAGVLAIALGFKQSLGDLRSGAHQFVLTRPVTRHNVYLTKISVGLALHLLIAALPVVIYSIWAATPGTHASPFAWSMTIPTWLTWAATSLVYLGAFLSGLRSAAWMGTRLAPVIAASAAALLCVALSPIVGLVIVIVGDLLLVMLILSVADSRDFS